MIGIATKTRVGKKVSQTTISSHLRVDDVVFEPLGRPAPKYYRRKGFQFILTEKKTIVQTRYQTFVIKHDHRNYVKQGEVLRTMIENGEMTSLSELITYCSYKPGGFRDQMCGLELVPTRLEWHL